MIRASQHIAALDGVRGLAILGVLVFHLYTPVGSWTTRITGFGGSGVELFFVLSGFLITGILLDAKAHPHRFFKNFYARRALRILPLYYGTLLLLLVLVPAIHPIHDEKFRFTIEHQVWLWLYLNNLFEAHVGRAMPLFGHFWSLAIEEQFYLVWPLIVFHATPRALRWICAGCVASALIARIGFLTTSIPREIVPRITLCQIDALAIGAALATTVRMEYDAKLVSRASLIALGAVVVLVAVHVVHPPFAASSFSQIATSTIFDFGYGGLVFAAVGGLGTTPLRWLELRPLRSLGQYSYGVYVFHWSIGRAFTAAFPAIAHTTSEGKATAFALLQMAVCFAVAVVSWHVFERHFIALKKRFAPQE